MITFLALVPLERITSWQDHGVDLDPCLRHVPKEPLEILNAMLAGIS